MIPSVSQLPLRERLLIEQLCDELEEAWQRDATSCLDDCVQRLSPAARPAGLYELVILDAAMRRDRWGQSGPGFGPVGTEPSAASGFGPDNAEPHAASLWQDYVRRYPELGDAGMPAEFAAAAEPAVIEGRFALLRTHSGGGLGRVLLARDLDFDRQIAVKELHDRIGDDSAFQHRFLREAVLTGQLEHPCIVPVYALGRHENGAPWYAMRFVGGESLQEAIAACGPATGPLSVRRRRLVKRLADICDAVAFAHSRGIVHRDIKPQNILLGEYGETWLVDWGLAARMGDSEDPCGNDSSGGASLRATPPGAMPPGATPPGEPPLPEIPPPVAEPDAGAAAASVERAGEGFRTQAGTVLGTPAYMSPEQAAGESAEVGRASDIYSLGATLVHVLTGRPPDAAAGGVDAATAAVPAGPLRAVCQKAMARNPAARYDSARALAADLELVLADQPIAAYRDPWLTRARRWIQRHRTLATAAGSGALLLLLGLLALNWQARRHAAELVDKNAELDRMLREESALRRQAAAAERRTRNAVEYLVRALRSPDPELDGERVRIVEVLDQAARQIDEDFRDDPLMRTRMLLTIARTFEGLSLYDRARPLAERAYADATESSGVADELTLEAGCVLAEVLNGLADPHAESLIAELLQRSRKRRGPHDELTLRLARTQAVMWSQGDRPADAVAALERLFPQFQSVFGEDAGRTESLMNDLANACYHDGQIDRAAGISRELFERRRERLGLASARTIMAGSNYAAHLRATSDRDQVTELLEELLAAARATLGETHIQTLVLSNRLGNSWLDRNDLDRAIPLIEESLLLSRERFGPDHPRTLVAANSLGTAWLNAGEYEQAIEQYRRVHAAAVVRHGPAHPETLTMANNLASACRLNGDYEDAVELLRTTHSAQQDILGPGHPKTVRSLINLAATLQDADRAAESLPEIQQAVTLGREHLGVDNPLTQTALSIAGLGYLAVGSAEEAEVVLRECLNVRSRTMPDHWLRYHTMSVLGESLLRQGRLQEAESLLVESHAALVERFDAIPVRARVRIDQAAERLDALRKQQQQQQQP